MDLTGTSVGRDVIPSAKPAILVTRLILGLGKPWQESSCMGAYTLDPPTENQLKRQYPAIDHSYRFIIIGMNRRGFWRTLSDFASGRIHLWQVIVTAWHEAALPGDGDWWRQLLDEW